MLEHHPRLAELSRRQASVADYYRSIATEPVPRRDTELAGVLGRVAQRLADRTYGTARVDLAAILGQPRTIVSFAEHHASITHPDTTTAVAIQMLYAMLSGAHPVSFAVGTVPLNNDLFPRGVMIGPLRFPFLSNKYRRTSVLTCPRIDHELFLRSLDDAGRMGAIEPTDALAIGNWWCSVSPAIEDAGNYWQQISILNRCIYDDIFDAAVPAPVMLPMELVTRDLLLTCLAEGRATWLLRNLFDPAARHALLECLDGVRCFWSSTARRGTFLFWHADPDGILRPAYPDADRLVSFDGRAAYRFDPEVIRDALSSNQLIPAASCAYLALVFQCGLRNFGGPLQYDYLAQAKQRLLARADIDLTPDERSNLDAVPDSYYLDFREKKILSGGLGRIRNPVPATDIESIGAEPMGEHMRSSLRWVNELGKSPGAH
jgi:hypothetical protein